MCKHILSLCGYAHVSSETRECPGPLELEFQKWRVLETEQDTTFSSGNAVGELGEHLDQYKPFFKEAPALLLLRCKSWYSCDVRKQRQSRGVQKPLVVSGNYMFSVAATLPSSWFSKRPWLKRSREKGNETGHSISTSGLWTCSPTPPMHAHVRAHRQAHTEVSKITLQSGRLSVSEEMVDRHMESWIRSWTKSLCSESTDLKCFSCFMVKKAPYSRGAVQAHWVVNSQSVMNWTSWRIHEFSFNANFLKGLH